jgi:hypothetical protein
MYIRMGSTRCRDYQQLVPQGIHPGTWHSSIYIRMGSTRCTHYSSLCHKGKIYTQDMAPPCISEWDLHGTCYYQQLVPQPDIHQDMAFLHVYIRMGSTQCCDYYLLTREKYTRDWHSSMYIRILCSAGWQIYPGTWHSSHAISGSAHGAATSYYQLVPQGRNIHPGTWHSSMYISEWDLRCRHWLLPALCHKGKIYTQDMAFLHIQNGIYTVPPATTTSSLCHKGEIYTQGHGIPLYIYQNGIYAVLRCAGS